MTYTALQERGGYSSRIITNPDADIAEDEWFRRRYYHGTARRRRAGWVMQCRFKDLVQRRRHGSTNLAVQLP